MKFDDILIRLGAFGPFQRRVYFLLTMVAIPSALHTFSMVFMSAKTDYWCATPELAAFNCSAAGLDEPDGTCSAFLRNISVPREVDWSSGQERRSQCKRFNLSGLDLGNVDAMLLLSQPPLVVEDEEDPGEVDDGEEEGFPGPAYNLSREWEGDIPIIECDAGWDFDTSQYKSSIIHQYELVCDNASNAKYAQSAYFAGMLVGAFFIGLLADLVGRKPTFLLCLVCSTAAGIAQAFAPSLAVFIVVRFIVGAFKLGLYMMAFIIGTEFVGPSYRAFAGQFINIYYAIGYMLLAPFAYLIRDWQMLQLALTMTFIPFFFLVPFIPESARWLVSRGRHEEAEKILRKMAKVNGVDMPPVVFDKDEEQDEEKKQEQQVAVVRRYTYLDLILTPNIRCKTLNLLLCWFVNNMVYYGIALSTSDLGVDHYVAAFVSGAVEIPAYISAILAMQYIGRRLPLCFYLVASGVACVVATFFSPGPGRAAVAMIGKFFITASFGVIYTYSAELYATPVRSMGMGLSSMLARISGILCPFILDLGSVWHSLPYFIFGAFSITSGALILLLPETLDKPLPETLEDAEMAGKGESCLCLRQCRQGTSSPTPDGVDMEKRPYSSLPTDDNDRNQDDGQDKTTENV